MTRIGSMISLLLLTPGVWGGANEFIKEKSKDFGTTTNGPVLVHYFEVKNTSQATVTLGTPRVSCGCVAASVGKTSLKPGETTSVIAYMDTKKIPMANVVKTVIVYVPFISPYYEEVSLSVSATKRDDLVMSNDIIDFGTVRKGEEKESSITVTLYNFPSWKVTEAKSFGLFLDAKVKEVKRDQFTATYEVTGIIKPNSQVGNWVSEIYLNTNFPGMNKLRVPVRVNIVSPITVNPGKVEFGSIASGSTEQKNIIISGTDSFKVLGVDSANKNITVTQITQGARPTHLIRVSFKAEQAGTIQQSIVIKTDNKLMPELKIPVEADVNK